MSSKKTGRKLKQMRKKYEKLLQIERVKNQVSINFMALQYEFYISNLQSHIISTQLKTKGLIKNSFDGYVTINKKKYPIRDIKIDFGNVFMEKR